MLGGTRAGALFCFSRPKSLKKTFLRNLAKLDSRQVQPEILGLQTLNRAGFSPERDFGESSAWGNSSRCTFLKNIIFELFAAKKSKKDVFEKPGQARFFPGPNLVAKGVQPEISILNRTGFSPARDFWETSSWRDSSFDSGFLFQDLPTTQRPKIICYFLRPKPYFSFEINKSTQRPTKFVIYPDI